MSIVLTLLPWEPRVSAGCECVELTVERDRVILYKHTDAVVSCPNGWFAIYEGAVFGVFEWSGAKDCQVALFIEGRIWHLTSDVQLRRFRTLTHRSFHLKSRSGIVVFDYQKFWWSLFHKPKAALLDVITDDWWGIVCDLPGWVEDHWESGKLANELANSLKLRKPLQKGVTH